MSQTPRIRLRRTWAYEDSFGHLPRPISVSFSRGAIVPLGNFKKRLSFAARRAHPDGYIYPPWRELPAPGRPVLLWGLPATHALLLNGVSSVRDEVRRADGGFVMHFLGLIFGGRYQFFDWWFEGRVQMSPRFEFAAPEANQLGACIDTALTNWTRWGARQRKIAANALYLFGRTGVHERESDRFGAEYQVLDAAFALAWQTGGIPGGPAPHLPPHSKRIELLCSAYGLAFCAKLVKRFVLLRNPLLHEAMWDDEPPGNPASEASVRASYWLHKLSQRVLLSVLGLEGNYLKTPWWEMGSFVFDVK